MKQTGALKVKGWLRMGGRLVADGWAEGMCGFMADLWRK